MSGADERIPPAWRVTAGGEPTAEEIAAITIALTPTHADDATAGADAQRRDMGNWQRAAIIEGIGGRPPQSLQDFWQGRWGLGTIGDPVSQG